MKRLLAWMVAVLVLAAPLSAGEAVNPDDGVLKIGVVEIQKVFDNYKLAKSTRADLEQNFESARVEIDNLRQEIQAEMQALQTNTTLDPRSASVRMQALDIRKKELLLEEKEKRFNSDLRVRMADFFRTVYKDFRQAVRQIGYYRGYDLIITAPNTDLSEEVEGTNNPQAVQSEILLRRVQYLASTVDITQQVVDQMNYNFDNRDANTGN